MTELPTYEAHGDPYANEDIVSFMRRVDRILMEGNTNRVDNMKMYGELRTLRADTHRQQAEIERLTAENKRYFDALNKLARLGNEPALGNSTGNMIAREAVGEKNLYGIYIKGNSFGKDLLASTPSRTPKENDVPLGRLACRLLFGKERKKEGGS